MMPPEITELYQQTHDGTIDRSAFSIAAHENEAYLMAFLGHTEPDEAILHQIFRDSLAVGAKKFYGYDVVAGGQRELTKKFLVFMLATALAAPTKNLNRIFNAYMLFINDHQFQFRDTFEKYSDHQLGDVRALVKLADPNHLKRILRLVNVSFSGALVDVISNDDLDAYSKLWSVYDCADEVEEKFGKLALFPIDPERDIHQALIVTEQDQKNLFLCKIFNLRNQVEKGFLNASRFLRNPDPSTPTLFPGGAPIVLPNNPENQPLFYREPSFSLGVQQDTFRCVQGFFTPSDSLDVRDNHGWEHIDGITQAFLDAGVSAQYILTYGLCREFQGDPLISLQKAMGHLSMLNKPNLRFYSAAYRAFFKDFDTKTLLNNCATDASREALYAITRDKDVLRLAGPRARDGAFASDLGL